MIYQMISTEDLIEDVKKKNSIFVISGRSITRADKIEGLQINFKGEGNIVVVFGNKNQFVNCRINLRKDDLVVINESKYEIRSLHISSLGERTFTWIGEDFSCSQTNMDLKDKKGICVGNDCMFSKGIYILNSDMHAILDEKGKLINPSEDVYVGNHVWIAQNVEILKGARIPNKTLEQKVPRTI